MTLHVSPLCLTKPAPSNARLPKGKKNDGYRNGPRIAAKVLDITQDHTPLLQPHCGIRGTKLKHGSRSATCPYRVPRTSRNAASTTTDCLNRTYKPFLKEVIAALTTGMISSSRISSSVRNPVSRRAPVDFADMIAKSVRYDIIWRRTERVAIAPRLEVMGTRRGSKPCARDQIHGTQ